MINNWHLFSYRELNDWEKPDRISKFVPKFVRCFFLLLSVNKKKMLWPEWWVPWAAEGGPVCRWPWHCMFTPWHGFIKGMLRKSGMLGAGLPPAHCVLLGIVGRMQGFLGWLPSPPCFLFEKLKLVSGIILMQPALLMKIWTGKQRAHAGGSAQGNKVPLLEFSKSQALQEAGKD